MRLRSVAALAILLAFGPELGRIAYEQGLLLLGAGPTVPVQAQSAPSDATYITQSSHASLSAEQALSTLSDGLLRHTAGVVARAVPGTDYDPELTLRLTGDVARSSAVFADVSGWTWSVAASGVYRWHCEAVYTTAVSTTAIQLAMNGPASPTALRYAVEVSTSATARHQGVQSAYDTVTNPATGHNTGGIARVWGTLENGANAGTLAVRLRTEIDTSAVTLLRGGTCRVVTL